MKKVPSYPKITAKTTLTFTQTQDININSPKSLAFSSNNLSAKKMFKSAAHNLQTNLNINKFSRDKQRERQKSNNSYTKNASNVNGFINTLQKNQKNNKSKIHSQQKGSKSNTQLLLKRDNHTSPNAHNSSSTNHLKISKNFEQDNSVSSPHKKHDHQTYKKQQQKKSGGQIKKLSQKLKLLQKKIDGLKLKTSSSSKRKKQTSQSQRSKSKIRDQKSNVYGSGAGISYNNLSSNSKENLLQFQKVKSSSNDPNTKILKKSYSDKNMIKSRPPKIPSPKAHVNNINSHNNEKQQSPQFYYEDQSPQNLQVKPHSSNKGHLNYKVKKQSQPQQHEQQIIHKFVTQVQKNPKMVQKHHHNNLPNSPNNTKIHYYVTNLSLSLKNTDFMIYKQHLIQSLHTLTYLHANTRRPTMKQLQKCSVNLKVHNKNHKYTIVLDLDQTLIHCNQSIDIPYDVSLKIKFPTGQKIDAGVNIRPHAISLLKQLSEFCQIIVFTASHECYANVVLDHLDPHKKYISHRLYRNHCWQTEQGIYIKDLRILKNRDMQNVLLVDNAAYSYFYQLQNGIPIIPFYDDKQDEQLIHLIKYIKTLIRFKQNNKLHNTLKKANHNYFKLTEYIKFNDLEKLTKNLYEHTLKEFDQFHSDS